VVAIRGCGIHPPPKQLRGPTYEERCKSFVVHKKGVYNTDMEKKTVKLNMAYCIEKQNEKVRNLPEEEWKRQQDRTIIKKKLFLEAWEKYRFIEMACFKADISSKQFRVWREEDVKFREEYQKIMKERNEAVEDLLMQKIFKDKDAPCIRFYLEKRSPEYKPKTTTEIITPTKSLKEMIDEDERELNNEDANNNQQQKSEDKQGTHRGIIENKNKEGGDQTNEVQPGAGDLLGKKD